MRQLPRILLIGAPVLAAATLAFGLFILPQLAANKLAIKLKERHGLDLVVNGSAGLSLANGIAATFGDVTVSDPEVRGVPLARIARMTVAMPLSSLFTSDSLRHVILDDAVFSFAAKAEGQAATGTSQATGSGKTSEKPFIFELRNASLLATDPDHQLSITATDISGEVKLSDDKILTANLRGLLNGNSTTLELNVDDTARLRQKGSPADVTLVSGDQRVALAGRLGLARSLTFDGSVSAESPDVQKFLAWLGLNTTGFAIPTPVAFDAGLSISKSKADFSNLAFALGDMQAKGKLQLQAAHPVPQLSADLAFNSIDLNSYGARPTDSDTGKPPVLTEEWKERPFDLSDLKSLDANVTLSTDVLKAGAVTAGPTTLTARLTQGNLVSKLESNALYGGKAIVDFALGQAEPSALALTFDIADAEAQTFLTQAFGVTFLQGPVSLKADLKAQGQSPAQWVSTLTGAANVTLKDGTIDGLDLADFANLVARDDLEGWGITSGNATAIASAVATATFADGIATLSETNLQAAGATATLEGTVDLLRRAIDVQAKPSTKGGTTLPVAFRATGPWDKPKFTAKVRAEEVLRSVTDDGLADQIEDVAKGTAKKAKKTLKKLFGN